MSFTPMRIEYFDGRSKWAWFYADSMATLEWTCGLVGLLMLVLMIVCAIAGVEPQEARGVIPFWMLSSSIFGIPFCVTFYVIFVRRFNPNIIGRAKRSFKYCRWF